MRATYLAAVSASAALLSTPVSAESVSGTRSGEVAETAHNVRILMDRGHADLVIERTVANHGASHEQAMFGIDVPDGAVATRLRTLGYRNHELVWFEGELLEAEEAARRYQELTGIGGYYPKDPALLSWRDKTHLALQVFPIAPGDDKTVSYTLRRPTRYENGADRMTLGRMGTQEFAASFTVDAAHPEDRLLLDGRPIALRTRVLLASDEEHEIALVRAAPPVIDGSLAVVPFGSNALSHFRFAIAPKISRAPRGAAVVVILDASRSVDESEVEASKAIARATLSHFADASVEVLTVDRKVHARYGRLVPVAQAMRDLGRTAIVRKNGSQIDDALVRAASVLFAAPAGTPKRIVLVTDGLVRSRLDERRLMATMPRGLAIVHAGIVSSGNPYLERYDEHEWAPAFRTTGGLVWHAGGDEAADSRGEMAKVYEEWARPMHIDNAALVAPGFAQQSLETTQLDEGQAVERLEIASLQVPYVELMGEMWARPVRKRLVPSSAETTVWAALAFGSGVVDDLTDTEQMAIAKRGHAVSPVTSLLAIEPGVRPSTEGLDDDERSGFGMGDGMGFGSMHTIGHGAGVGREPIDPEKFLYDALSAAWAECGGGAKTAKLVVETTLAEVVDVRVAGPAGKKNAELRQCIEDAAWDLDLVSDFNDAWASYDVNL